MPSKIQLDENLWFLYICLQKSDLKSIDFTAVGEATNLKPPAARMRYTRLRRQIESGTLIGAHGTPFLSSSPSTKRKRIGDHKAGDESGEEMDVKVEGWVGKAGMKGERKVKKERMVKEEGSDRFESSESESEWDSEDEIPLAKLRKAKLGYGSGSATQGHISSSSIDAGLERERETQLRSGQLQGVAAHGFAVGSRACQSMISRSAVPRYMPSMEGGEWQETRPLESLGIDSRYAVYGGWGSGSHGVVEGWDQSLPVMGEKPRKSV